MILIITADSDSSSYRVIDWFNYFDVPYIQLDKSEPIHIVDINISNNEIIFLLKIRDQIISTSEISRIWYRRSAINFTNYKFQSEVNITFENSINSHLKFEEDTLRAYFWHFLEERSLNKPSDNELNKYIALETCKKFGILIPESIITSDKQRLLEFLNEYDEIITKNGTQGLSTGYKGNVFYGLTTKVTKRDIDTMGETFFPSFFQQMIQKSFELRVFYIEGDFYASAIFSQSDEKTKIDFRNYNGKKPNRTPPYELPTELKKNLNSLMIELNLNCGSIDLLVDLSGNYYFLEVNPIGQFRQVSLPCNYHLEMIVAQNLMK
ncbi:MAG: ATP-GRASP peptide maturase of grasp-with-spasm system [Crocinitomix sp.]|jgi:ATP-GRASP peptide maturase of grasp-with-spasm system